MYGINNIILVGHLGTDPDISRLNDIISVNFPFVTSETIYKNGEQTETTEWHNIVMSSRTAENAIRSLRKGSLVYLEGKARARSFDDTEGLKKRITEIEIYKFQILDQKSNI